MKVRTLHIILVILIVGLVSGNIGFFIGVNKVAFDWKNYKPLLSVTSKEPPSQQNVDFSQFWTVWQKVEEQYYDKSKLDSQKMVQGAISGMVQSLGDPYTVYLPPTQNSDFKQGMAGQFEGIGAELGMKDKQIIVVAPLDGMPAKKAGIRSGDAILKVNDQPTAGWTLSQAVEKIRGPKGTDVTLTILHKEETKAQEVKIQRGTITVKSVNAWIKPVKDIEGVKITDSAIQEKRIGYIRLSQFGDNTNAEWLAAINDIALKMEQEGAIEGIVLDLRNNPGGYLTDATFIASEFIKDGTVVIQDRGDGQTKTTFAVNRKGLLTEIPVIVLINRGSASASEILAGALRDHNRAILVGETSFGKGTIQQAEDLGGGSGIHVTIAKWLTPNGTWVHEKGLEPDIAVDLNEKDLEHDTQLEKAMHELIK